MTPTRTASSRQGMTPRLALRAPNRGLEVVVAAAESTIPAARIVIVTVPWLMHAREWAICLPEHPVTERLGNVEIYAYEAWFAVDDRFTWLDLVSHGQSLAQRLQELHTTDPSQTPVPILLMAHSLAGFILKQCLIELFKHRDTYHALRESIIGAVFLGAPHCSLPGRQDVLQDKCAAILSLSGLSRRSAQRLQGKVLVDMCSEFDNIGVNIITLSVYEKKPTKVVTGLLRTSSIDLVDQVLARIDNNAHERVVGIDTSHQRIPTLRNDGYPSCLSEECANEFLSLVERGLKGHRQPISIPLKPATQGEQIALGSLVDKLKTPQILPELPCFLMGVSRQRNKDFCGRESVLADISSQLRRGKQVAVLSGIGGLGKSDVALEFAHQQQKEFDATFWIPADDIVKMRQSFGQIASQLKLGAAASDIDPHMSREIAKAWLLNPIMKDGAKARWLIIFDGADDINILKEFEEIYGLGSVLITTQNSKMKEVIPSLKDEIKPITLDFFSEEEGAAVLKRLVSPDGADESDECARQIVRSLDGWPLAISHTAGIIRSKFLTLTEFQEWSSHEDANSDTHTANSNRRTMMSSLRLAKLSKSASALLQVFAMLDSDCIQESLFGDVHTSDIHLDDFPRNRPEFSEARAELLRASLIQRNKQKQQLWMHKFVQRTVRSQCSADVHNAAFHTAAELVARVWEPPGPAVRDCLKLWEPCSAYLSHVFNMQHIYDKQTGRESTIQPCLPLARLLSEAASFQTNLGNTAGLETTLNMARHICESMSRERTFDLLSEIYHALGGWANETNHPEECYKYNDLYLRIRLEPINAGKAEPDAGTAAAYNQFGTALMMLGQRAEAKSNFEESIEIYKRIADPRSCQDSLPIVNLANAEWLMGHHDVAAKLLEKGYLAREEKYGTNDQSFRTGRFYQMLGNVRFSEGRLEESATWHKRALKQYTRVLGSAHHRTADVCHRVAQHCLNNNELDAAGALIDQALKSWNFDEESFRPEIARTTWLRAKLLGMRGIPKSQSKVQNEAVELRKQLRPDDSRQAHELEESDFDELVAFWSR